MFKNQAVGLELEAEILKHTEPRNVEELITCYKMKPHLGLHTPTWISRELWMWL